MSRARRILIGAVLALSLLGGTALAAQKLNAYALQSQFMCVFCHQPLNQVNDTEADVEKATLRHLVNRDLDLTQIKNRMVAIYGEEVLAKPPAHGINLLVYILPPVVVVGGIGLIAYNLPRWRRQTRVQQAAGAGPTGPPPDPSDSARLDRELAEFDR